MKPGKLLLAASVMAFFCLYVFSLSYAFNIDPVQPVKGDEIKLTDSCSPGAVVPVTLKFSRSVGVSGGEYEYDVGTLDIPSGTTLSIRAENVVDLKLGMKVLIWITITVQGSNGVASYGSSIISGKRRLKVFGNALAGASTVKLDFTAKTDVLCDGAGNLLFTYDSQYLPTGLYTIKVGGDERLIELYSEKPSSTGGGAGTPTPTPVPGDAFYLVANEVDFDLSRDLIDDLEQYHLVAVSTSTPQSCTLVLGGPDALFGTGEIVRSYLSMEEQERVRRAGSKEFFAKPRLLVVAGSDRAKTHEAFGERFMEVVAHLVSCVNS
jgi:hypothetical protein